MDALSEAVLNLRLTFHRLLSKKRGLVITEDDLAIVRDVASDKAVQNRLDRFSTIRRLLFFGKRV